MSKLIYINDLFITISSIYQKNSLSILKIPNPSWWSSPQKVVHLLVMGINLKFLTQPIP